MKTTLKNINNNHARLIPSACLSLRDCVLLSIEKIHVQAIPYYNTWVT